MKRHLFFINLQDGSITYERMWSTRMVKKNVEPAIINLVDGTTLMSGDPAPGEYGEKFTYLGAGPNEHAVIEHNTCTPKACGRRR